MIFPFVFLQEGEAGLAQKRRRRVNNTHRAVISLDREQTEEITAEDGFILRIVEKGKETQSDVDFRHL